MASKYAKNEPTRYNNEEFRIVMVGKTGGGKSAAGNTILGNQHFESKFSPKSLTTVCEKAFGEVDGQMVAIVDTPGLFDTRVDEETTVQSIIQCISYASPGPHAFLVVVKLGRYTEEEKNTVQKIQEIFGEDADKYSMVLFTHGDQLEETPIEEFLKDSEDLQELVDKCNGQYHVLNNKVKDRSQVRELLNKINNITEKNGGRHHTTEKFQKTEKAIEEEKQRILKEKEEEMHKQREELKKELEEQFEKQTKKINADREREDKLREAHDRKMEMVIKQLKEKQEKQARKEAESSFSVLKTITEMFLPILEVCYFLIKAFRKLKS